MDESKSKLFTKGKIIALSVIVLLGILGWTIFESYRSVYDRNVNLKNDFKAQKDVVAGNYDKMWKVLRDQAQLTEEHADKFKEIYADIIGGRYSDGQGSLMMWVTEQNPQFDQGNYAALMQNIEALRTEFETEQKKVIAIMQQHNNLREEFWSSIWLGDEPALEYTMITSTKTQNVVETGQDDDALFKKDTAK